MYCWTGNRWEAVEKRVSLVESVRPVQLVSIEPRQLASAQFKPN